MKKLFPPLNAAPYVAIVILNWNGRAYLEKFLPSVLDSAYPNFTVIVADNASADDSVPFLKAHAPTVEIIQLNQNYGFAKGYNLALKQVRADYYLLLNSDVEVTPGWIAPLVNWCETHENVAACQPKIRSFNFPQLFEYAGAAGGWIDAYGYPFARGRVFDGCETDAGQYNAPQAVFWASGAALLISPGAFWKAGGFDESFFAHQEEIDLCWRLQLLGYGIACCPQSVVYHVGGGTLPRGNSRKTFLNFRNNLMMLQKNLQTGEALWKIPVRLMLDLVSACKGFLTGDRGYFLAILRAHAAFYQWLFFAGKMRSPAPKRLAGLRGVYKGNIAWQHFIIGKKTFSQIVKQKF